MTKMLKLHVYGPKKSAYTTSLHVLLLHGTWLACGDQRRLTGSALEVLHNDYYYYKC